MPESAEPTVPQAQPNETPSATQGDPAHEVDWKAEAEKFKGLARKHEDRAKESYEWRKANEAKVQQYEALEAASKTEAERAVEAAREEARKSAIAETEAAALRKYGSVLVAAEFRAQLAGKVKPEDAAALADGLDITKFLTADGQPDADRIASHAAILVSAQTQTQQPPPRPRIGQGVLPPVTTPGEAGAAEAARRFGGK